MFNAKLRKIEIDNYNEAIYRYENIAAELGGSINDLYSMRIESLNVIKQVEEKINQLANSPKEFKVSINKIRIEIKKFDDKQHEIKKAEVEAKKAAGSAGAGATLGALGIAVATMGPIAAMGIATTFGVASTGTAISALSGAAATNAALAWLGGGALAAGGGGISAGSAFLALAGPVGWSIAGIMFAGSLGAGLYANKKNMETVEKLILERENIEKIIRKFNNMNSEVIALYDITKQQISGITSINDNITSNDYKLFTKDEKIQAGLLVNSTLSLAQLINKELKLDDQ